MMVLFKDVTRHFTISDNSQGRREQFSFDDLSDTLFLRWLIHVVTLHQMTTQTDILREAASAYITTEVSAASTFIFQMF